MPAIRVHGSCEIDLKGSVAEAVQFDEAHEIIQLSPSHIEIADDLGQVYDVVVINGGTVVTDVVDLVDVEKRVLDNEDIISLATN